MKKGVSVVLIIGFILIAVGVGLDACSDIKEAVNNMTTSKTQEDYGLNITVDSVEDKSTIGSGFTETTTSDNFIVISLTIENTGDEAWDVNVTAFELVADDKEYSCSDEALLAVDDHMYLDNLNPGISKSYKLVYETPFQHTDKECKLKVIDNAFTNKYFYVDL